MNTPKEVSVYFDKQSGRWMAQGSEQIAFGSSPEEAVRILADLEDMVLPEPTQEDWITPGML